MKNHVLKQAKFFQFFLMSLLVCNSQILLAQGSYGESTELTIVDFEERVLTGGGYDGTDERGNEFILLVDATSEAGGISVAFGTMHSLSSGTASAVVAIESGFFGRRTRYTIVEVGPTLSSNCVKVDPNGVAVTHGGVTVTNNTPPQPDGKGPYVKICSTTNSAGKTTTDVRSGSDMTYTVSGLSDCETVCVQSGCDATISGTAGTVEEVTDSAAGTITSTGGIKFKPAVGDPQTVTSANSPFTF